MSKYDALGAHLARQAAAAVPMRFSEIEAIVGFELPPVARSARAWWSNNPSNNVMTRVWVDAGFQSEQVDMTNERLVFRRRAPKDLGPSRRPPSPSGVVSTSREHPSVAETFASSGSHALFGCMKGTVRRADDLDLTAPADPAWGLDL